MSQAPSSSASAARVAAWRRLNQLRPLAGPPGAQTEGLGETADLESRRDRAQASRLVRGVLRNLGLLDALLERPTLFDPLKTPPALRWILRLAVYEKIFQSSVPDYAIGAQAVELARKAGGPRAARFVNAVIRRLLPTIPDSPEALGADPFIAELPDSTRWSVPAPLIQALASGYGTEEVRPVLGALAEQEAPVWLRVNTLRTTPARLAEALEVEGILVEPTPNGPEEILRWTGEGGLPWDSAAWGRGELTVQDVGAAFAARLLAPTPGQAVLDLCAAPGGKTGHLWERMQGQGRLVALEVNPQRRGEMRLALQRLYGQGHPIAIPEVQNIGDLPAAAGFDRVLIDAPCQALGLIRRHPEIRWDRRLEHQAAMTATQRQILNAGARCVNPGGRLLWVTCSPTAAENEQIILAWLAAHPDWRLLDPRPQLDPAWLPALQITQNVIRTRPDRLACDGFAMILIERQLAS